jgi:hypothetical protein
VKLPPIKHVWLIALSGVSLSAKLSGRTADSYLVKQLIPKGTLLSGYTLASSSELANGMGLLSGQGVNLDTEQSCPTYVELQPATVNATNGLAEGVGCVYPATVKTLADELAEAGLTWKAYVQAMEGSQSSEGSPGPSPTPASASNTSGNPGPSPTPASAGSPTPTTSIPTAAGQLSAISCRRPELGAGDPNHAPLAGDPYLTSRNPFVYFHSLLDSGACASDDVDLDHLASDLTTPATTPSFSWIVPSACEDGSATPCAPGAAAGLGPADAFLKVVVPRILATAAYRQSGLIVIVPDSAPSTPGSATSKPVGALLLSPFVRSAARVPENLNDFSLLRSLTRLFGVLPLGHANDPSAVSLSATVYRTTK